MYNLYSWMSQPQVTSRTPINQSPLMHSGLHRVIYMEGSTLTTQVAFPHLGGKTKSHLLNFQKQLLIPELHEYPLLSVALAVADDKHWNIADDPIYPACLAEFRKRQEASQASQASKSVKKSGTGEGSPLLAMTFPQQPAQNLLPYLL